MTLDMFLQLQQDLMATFGWLLRWWLILFAVVGVLAAALAAVLASTIGLIDEF